MSHPSRLLVGVIAGFGLLILFNFVAGIREDESWPGAIIDSFEEYALGVLLAGTALFLLGRIAWGDPWPKIVGLLAVGAITGSLAVSLGTAQLGENPAQKVSRGFPTQFLIAVSGAVIVGTNIAPTQEVATVAAAISPVHELGILLLTVLMIAAVTRYGHLKNQTDMSPNPPLNKVLFTTAVTFLAALVAAVPAMWFFGRYDDQSFSHNLSQTVVMLFPAALGAVLARALIEAEGEDQEGASA